MDSSCWQQWQQRQGSTTYLHYLGTTRYYYYDYDGVLLLLLLGTYLLVLGISTYHFHQLLFSRLIIYRYISYFTFSLFTLPTYLLQQPKGRRVVDRW